MKIMRKGKKGLALLAMAILLGVASLTAIINKPAAAEAAEVQAKYGYANHGTSVTSTLTNTAHAGNLLAVYVVWSNTDAVTVTDDQGNTYTPAGDKTTWYNGMYSGQVFYAKNIHGGESQITATFESEVYFGVLYTHEYSGLSKANPFDVTSATEGTGTDLNSGNVTTTHAHDLLFGAGASGGAVDNGGAGFTVRSLDEGNLIEDQEVTTTGSYSATGVHGGGKWVMQVVAFKVADAPTVPANLTATATSPTHVDLSWDASTDESSVTGYKIYRDGSLVATTAGTTYSDTGLTGDTAYSYTVAAVNDSDNESAQTAPVSVATGEVPGSTTCPLPEYPSPRCTGVPSTTELTYLPLNTEGEYRVTEDNTVLDGVHIPGTLAILANNVTIRNSQIDGTVCSNTTCTGSFTITDSTVGPETGCITSPGVGYANYTAIRVYVRGHDDGFRISPPGNVTVKDSFATLCYAPPEVAPPDGSHSDGIQAYCAGMSCSGLLFDHNTIEARGVPATSMINLNDPVLSDVTASNNMMAGGGYTVVLQWHSGPAWTVTNNHVINRHGDQYPEYDSWTWAPFSGEGTCDNQTWSGNSVVEVDRHYSITSNVRDYSCLGGL